MLMDWNKGTVSVPKITYRFNAISKIPIAFFLDLEQILKFMQNPKDPVQPKKLRKNKVEGSMLPDIKLHYKARIIRVYKPAYKHTHICTHTNKIE